MEQQKNDKRSLLQMIAALVIVGSIGIFRRYIPLSSGLLAFFRGLIGAGALFIFVRLRHRGDGRRPDGKTLLLLVKRAVLAVNWIFLFEAYSYTSIARASLCYYMQPTILVLLSPLVFHERLTGKKLICAFAALLGMVLVSGVFEAGKMQSGELRGILCGLAGAFFYSLVVILNKKIDGVDMYQRTIIQLFAASVMLMPYLLLTGGFSGMALDLRTLLLLLIVGVIHTGLVYTLYFASMNGLRAQTISALGYIDPIVAMIVSALVLGERLSLPGIIGAVLIIGSALVGERAPCGKTAQP